MSNFVHLRLHSTYSFSEGIVRIPAAIAQASADGMSALGLSDVANVFGLIKFHKAARKALIKPISGCEITVAESLDQPLYRLLVLLRNHQGYLCLCRLLTRAYENQRDGAPVIDAAQLAAEETSGLILLSGAEAGDMGQSLMAGNVERAREQGQRWAKLFPGRFYLEVQRHNDSSRALAPMWRALAQQLSLPLVATHPIRFLAPEDYSAFDARVCIAHNLRFADLQRTPHHSDQQYFKSTAQMQELFSDMPSALTNAGLLAQRCTLPLELGHNHLPAFPLPSGISAESHLQQEAARGLDQRLVALYPDPQERERQRPTYEERLTYELQVIAGMSFSGYFLIVADFVSWSKAQNIPVGPGRGSGAGSLVAFSLGITELDPLRYGLLFERFLNPERVSLPDFDIDFCPTGRDQVIEYVRQKYGRHSVSQIVTFNTFAARASVRSVGRVMGLSTGQVDRMAKLIPRELDITLERALAMESQIQQSIDRQEDNWNEVWPLAVKLEGLALGAGTHAGGVLIAPRELSDFTPLYAAAGSTATVSQFEKDDLEDLGLVKFDLLGLATLTIITDTIAHIRRLDPQSSLNIEHLPLDDPLTYQLFGRAQTLGVFQFESGGMRNVLRQAKPQRFEDLIALVALYRPGPMGLIPKYIRGMHNESGSDHDIEEDDVPPLLNTVLAETYGVMVYQEQVMQIAQVVSGFTLGRADLLRRAMGKKDKEAIDYQRRAFVSGAANNNVDQRTANKIFDLIVRFAGYGFNKSHAAAYALVAYQTAYLKAHYPAEFLAANMTASLSNTDRICDFVQEARELDITVLPPDVERSEGNFLPIDGHTLLYGLGAIKTVGNTVIEAVIEARGRGRAGSFGEFCQRLDSRRVNTRAMQALICAGAVDALTPHRAQAYADNEVLMNQSNDPSQQRLFGATALNLPAAEAWPKLKELEQEKSFLGFYFSGHPFKLFQHDLQELGSAPISAAAELPTGNSLDQRGRPVQGPRTLRAGIVVEVRSLLVDGRRDPATGQSRKEKMAFLTLEDDMGRRDAVLTPDIYRDYRSLIEKDRLVLVYGTFSMDMRGGERFTVSKIMSLMEARNDRAETLELSPRQRFSPQEFRYILERYRQGPCPVHVRYVTPIGEKCLLKLPTAWQVNLPEELLQDLRNWLKSEEQVRVIYRSRSSIN